MRHRGRAGVGALDERGGRAVLHSASSAHLTRRGRYRLGERDRHQGDREIQRVSSAVALFAQPAVRAARPVGRSRQPARPDEQAQVKLSTSTPPADPSGDYAFEVFRKADAQPPDAAHRRAEQRKAPVGRNLYGMLVGEDRADIFLNLWHQCARGGEAEPEPAHDRTARQSRGRRRLWHRLRPTASRYSSCPATGSAS